MMVWDLVKLNCGTKYTFQNVKELTINFLFIESLMALYFIKQEPASAGISPDSW
jgi:hypothetical protein